MDKRTPTGLAISSRSPTTIVDSIGRRFHEERVKTGMSKTYRIRDAHMYTGIRICTSIDRGRYDAVGRCWLGDSLGGETVHRLCQCRGPSSVAYPFLAACRQLHPSREPRQNVPACATYCVWSQKRAETNGQEDVFRGGSTMERNAHFVGHRPQFEQRQSFVTMGVSSLWFNLESITKWKLIKMRRI